MAIDPRQLKPGELARLLNSTALGEVISERQLHRHRTRAGFRVAANGDPGRIDLFRYVAWLVTTRHEALVQATAEPEGLSGYEALKERARERNALLSQSGRDIGSLPAVVDPGRRDSAARDFRRFCEAYFPGVFHLKWSDDHLKVIGKIEHAVLEGGLFAMAMPRGSGKTSLCETACLWAMLYGHRDFVALIGSDEEHAAGMLESIKAELENSDLLAADFPEVCHPIRSLEGIHQRAGGQLYQGRPTHIGWTAREIVLPSINGSPASGAVIRVTGITGRIRGMKSKGADGRSSRPSLVLVDDPQTDESARSPSQCASREQILAGAVLGLAGPGKKIAGLMTLTVVQRDDLADRLLDSSRHPHWTGERTKLIYSFPSATALWDQYAKHWAEGLREERTIARATEFYGLNRAAMDEGAQAAWAERFNHDELSAVQHAMNLKLQDERAFFAEYQNQPMNDAATASAAALTPELILNPLRLMNMDRRRCPLWATRVVGMVDVQADVLFYLLLAVADDFTACIIDYGTEPDQRASYFTLREVRQPLSAVTANVGLEGQLYAGLRRLMDRLVGADYTREDGTVLALERCMIDANWGASTDTVYAACRESPHRGVLTPSHGRYVGAAGTPIGLYKARPGERYGLNWLMPVPQGRRSVRHITYDTNFWKSFAASRVRTAVGDSGCVRVFGHASAASGRGTDHRMLADHCCSEGSVRTTGRGREVDEWRLRGIGIDNHWWDCLVGAYVAASAQGCQLPTSGVARVRARRRTVAEIRAQREQERTLRSQALPRTA